MKLQLHVDFSTMRAGVNTRFLHSMQIGVLLLTVVCFYYCKNLYLYSEEVVEGKIIIFPKIDNLNSILRSVADADNNVIAIIADAKYGWFAENWLRVKDTHASHIQNVVGLYIDDGAKDAFLQNGVTAVVNIGDWFQNIYKDDMYHRNDAIKAYFAILVMQLKYNILICDLDSIMLRDPFPLLCRDVDMEFQADVHQGALNYGNPHFNCGTWYARCSDREHCRAINVLWAWLNTLLAHPHEFGQSFIDAILNDNGMVTLTEATRFPGRVYKEELSEGPGTRICNVPVKIPASTNALVRAVHTHVICFEGQVFRNYSLLPAIVHVSNYKKYSMLALRYLMTKSDATRIFDGLPALTYVQDWSGSPELQVELFTKALTLAVFLNWTFIPPKFDCNLHPDGRHIYNQKFCDMILFFSTDTLEKVIDIDKILPNYFIDVHTANGNEITTIDIDTLEASTNLENTLTSIRKISSNMKVLISLKNLHSYVPPPRLYEKVLYHVTPSWHYFKNNWGLWAKYGFYVPGATKPGDRSLCGWGKGLWMCGSGCPDGYYCNVYTGK